ncbi:LAMI_0F04016g1_1 [Lachancea mirantina]|uniref:Anaphase-promoting complex subunit 5 n=1 Tax=Lachancea mirantina TaxID=1230905 RepID=A0A1G4JXH1_9SACH|nr:LAMI_0F04016g1_1 [Lachancea mirantina]
MTHRSRLFISETLTPHDVSILILLVFYCINIEQIDLDIFVKLIPPSTEESNDLALLEFNQGAPIVADATLFGCLSILEENNHKALAARLVSTLKSIRNVDGLSRLVRVLEKHCLKPSYRSFSVGEGVRVFKRQIAQGSFLGRYLSQCILRHKIEEFQESEILWENLLVYRSTGCYEDVDFDLDPVMAYIFTQSDTESDISRFNVFNQGLEDALILKKPPKVNGHTLMLFKNHLNALLSEEFHRMTRLDLQMSDRTKCILASMTLDDLSCFPTAHMLKYLQALRDRQYDVSLDELYKYFDYMLGYNGENFFHTSLLALASFHAHFYNNDIAVKTFEEATTVARENKDINTLNLLLMWVFEFLEKDRQRADEFKITTKQILDYLKSSSDDQSSIIFENAYKFESRWLLLGNTGVDLVLQATFKALVLNFQNLQFTSDHRSLYKHMSKVWRDLGSSTLSEVYSKLAGEKKDDCMSSYRKAEKAFDERDFATVRLHLDIIDSPAISYESRKEWQLLRLRFLKETGSYVEAMNFVNLRIKECKNECPNRIWKLNFLLEKCYILLDFNMAARCIPLIEPLQQTARETMDPKTNARLALLLVEILMHLEKLEEAIEVLNCTFHSMVQYCDYSDHKHIMRKCLIMKKSCGNNFKISFSELEQALVELGGKCNRN